MAKDSRYNKDAADFAVMFIESLCHTKGTWAGQPFELIDGSRMEMELKPCWPEKEKCWRK
jgi:hypothetical protein